MKRILYGMIAAVVLLLAGCKEENTPDGLYVNPEFITCPDAGGDYTVEVSSPDGAWTAASSVSWIKVTPTSGGKGKTEVRIKITANKETLESNGMVVFESGEKTVTLPVTRAAKAAPYLRVVSEAELNTPKEGGTYTVQVESNIKWSASSNAGWAKVSKGVSVNNDNVTITVDEATTPEETTAVITIAPYGEGAEAGKQEVVITRGSTEATSLAVNIAAIYAPETGGTGTVDVYSNARWRVHKTWDMDWVELSGDTEGTGDGSFGLSIGAAASLDAVSGIITVEEIREDNYKPVVAQVAVSRAGKAAASLSVSKRTINATAKGGDFPVVIWCNYPWTATMTGSKLFSVSTTSGDGDATMIVTVKPTTAEQEETGSITIRSSFGNEQVKINIRREGKPAPVLAIIEGQLLVASSGAEEEVLLTSNTSWRVYSSDPTVATVSPEAGRGDQVLHISVLPANDPENAMALIIAKTTDGSNICDTLRVIREGLPEANYVERPFSVSDTKQVYISPGNLQYRASTDTWRFANPQYQYMGYQNNNISSSYDGWIDLFGWGTGNNPTAKSISDAYYYHFTDWGVNAIHYGGDVYRPNSWRTLSTDEYLYLIFRDKDGKTLAGPAEVGGIHGHIILPDDWDFSNGLHYTGYGVGWNTNSYTLEEWRQMESYGAVFLPAAGYRLATTGVNFVQLYGSYWSNENRKNGDAEFLFFEEGPATDGVAFPSYGRSVRLVQDVR